MNDEENKKQSRLVAVLREGVSLVQMVFFKELRDVLKQHHPDKNQPTVSKLAGAITNELFGTPNPDPQFVAFLQENRAAIEQEMLGLATNLHHLRRYITDALRIQTLCDHQEGLESPETLATAEKLGVLLKEREIPLPSSFMTSVRELGEKHQLIIAPVQISPEEEQSIIH